MEDTLRFIVESIVTDPESVEVSRNDVDSAVTFTVTVPQEEIGKIIGKNGKTINAIRNIIKIVAAKQGKWVNIEVTEAV